MKNIKKYKIVGDKIYVYYTTKNFEVIDHTYENEKAIISKMRQIILSKKCEKKAI